MKYKIYQIVDKNNEEKYIGSTVKSLHKRLLEHKGDYVLWKLGKKNYISCFKILEGDNYEIQLLEEGICENKKEKLEREKYYINTIDCINIVKNPIRTEEELKQYNQEWRDLNKIKQKNYCIDYYIENKEKLKKNRNIDYQKNKEHLNTKIKCECGCYVNLQGISRHKKTKKHLELILKNV
jgi:hypothetical protein